MAVPRPEQRQRPGDGRRRRRPQGPELHHVRRRRLRAASGRPRTKATTWEPVFENAVSTAIGDIALDPSNPQTVWVGTGEANIFRSSQSGAGVYQVDRRRQDLDAHGPGRDEHDRPDRRPSQELRTSSMSPPRATNGRRIPTAASTRPSTAAKPGRRSSSSTTRPGPSTWSWTPRTTRRSMPRPGSGRARSGTTRATTPSPPAAGSGRRRTAERPGRRSTTAFPRRSSAAGSASTSASPSPTSSTPSSTTTRRPARPNERGAGRFLRPALGRDHQGRHGLSLGRQGRDLEAGERPDARAESVHGAPFQHLRLGLRPDPGRSQRREHGLHHGPQPEHVRGRRKDVSAAVRARAATTTPFGSIPTIRTTWSTASTRASPSPTTRARTGSISGRSCPVCQFFNIAYDMGTPFKVYGSMQDHGSFRAPVDLSRGRDRIPAQRLSRARRAARARTRPSIPTNPNIVYSAGFYGTISRTEYDRPGGRPAGRSARRSCRGIRERAAAPGPVAGAVHPLAAQPEHPLSRHAVPLPVARPGRHLGEDQPRPDAATVPAEMGDIPYHTLFAISESPLKFGLIYAGTDDGRVWMTKDGGKTWDEITPACPSRNGSRAWSPPQYDLGTVYMTQNGKRDDDVAPYVWKSTDYRQDLDRHRQGHPPRPGQRHPRGSRRLGISSMSARTAASSSRPTGQDLADAGREPALGLCPRPDRPSRATTSSSSPPTAGGCGRSTPIRSTTRTSGRAAGGKTDETDSLGDVHENYHSDRGSFSVSCRPWRLGADGPGPEKRRPAKTALKKVESTDPALRLKWFDQHQAMKAQTPFKDLKWRFIGPDIIGGRCTDIAVPKGSRHTIYIGVRHGRRLEDGQRRHHLGRRLTDELPTLSTGDLAVSESDPNIVWIGTGEANHLPGLDRRDRRLQIHGRRKDLDSHGSRRDADDRPDPRSIPTNPDIVYVAATGHEWTDQSRPRRLQDDRRRQNLAEGPLHQREDRGHRPGHGPDEARHPDRLDGQPDPAALERSRSPGGETDSSRPRTAARPGSP